MLLDYSVQFSRVLSTYNYVCRHDNHILPTLILHIYVQLILL